MNSRKYVYVFRSEYGSTNVVNYDAENTALNTFLRNFDMWGNNGAFKISKDSNEDTDHQNLEVWFECFSEFLDICKTDTFQRAFRNMGVKVVFEYPFNK